MARDTKNKYFYIGISPESQVYQRLLQDSREYGISIQKLLVLRAGDYYKGQSAATSQTIPGQAGTTDEVIDEDELEQADRNADAALDMWG